MVFPKLNLFPVVSGILNMKCFSFSLSSSSFSLSFLSSIFYLSFCHTEESSKLNRRQREREREGGRKRENILASGYFFIMSCLSFEFIQIDSSRRKESSEQPLFPLPWSFYFFLLLSFSFSLLLISFLLFRPSHSIIFFHSSFYSRLNCKADLVFSSYSSSLLLFFLFSFFFFPLSLSLFLYFASCERMNTN